METNNGYRSLQEIRDRKDALLNEIRKDDQQMRTHWNSLFHKPSNQLVSTPSRKLNTLMTTGAGVLDGIILAWKLYRKFGGKKSSRKRR